MRKQARIHTDTATIVLFDPLRLETRKDDECDWWTGDGDLEIEENARNLAFIDTGTDGIFQVEVIVIKSPSEHKSTKRSLLEVPSGELLLGAGEGLPGEGILRSRDTKSVIVEPGAYHVEIARIEPEFAGVTGRYCFCITLLR